MDRSSTARLRVPWHRLAGILLLALHTTAGADDFQWTGAAGNSDWNDPANWLNTTPGGPTDADGIPDADDRTTFDLDLTITGGDTRDLTLAPETQLTLDAGAVSIFAGTINNQGTLTFVGDTGSPANETLAIRGAVDLTGGGELVLVEPLDSLITSGSFNGPARLTNVDNTIRGTGMILAPLVNQATVRAEGGVLTLNTPTDIDNAAGRIEIAGDSRLDPHDPIVGGTVHGEADSAIGRGTFRDLTFTGSHLIDRVTFNKVTFEGTITNRDILAFSNAIRPFNADQTLAIRGPVVLTGGGEVIMTRERVAVIEDGGSTPEGAAELLHDNHTLRGTGTISVPVVNTGLIRAEGGRLNLNRPVTNLGGTVEIAADGVLDLHAITLTGGDLLGEAGSILQGDTDARFTGAFTGETTTRGGGLRDATNHGQITLTTETFHLQGDLTNTGRLTFRGDPDSAIDEKLGIVGPVTLDGGGEVVLLEENDSRIHDAGVTTDGPAHLTNIDNTLRGTGRIAVATTNHGTIQPEAGTLHVVNLTNADGGTITGNGTLATNAMLQNDGIIAPGASTGTLTVEGAITQSTTGELRLELAGNAPGAFDLLQVTGAVELQGGMLNVSLLDGFQPGSDDTFTVLTADAGLTGTFDNVAPGERLMLDSGGSFLASYGPDSAFDPDALILSDFLNLTPGDLNGDGVVDGLDIDPFVQLLTGGGFDPAADLNGDGTVDGLDIDPFVQILTGGSGTGATLTTIPEPATWLTLTLVAATTASHRRRCHTRRDRS